MEPKQPADYLFSGDVASTLICHSGARRGIKKKILPQTVVSITFSVFFTVEMVLGTTRSCSGGAVCSCEEHEGYFRVFLSARLPGPSGARPSSAGISGVIFRRIKNHGGPEWC